MKVTVLSGQSVFDIAIQTCGSSGTAFAIARANGMSVTGELEAGQELEIPPAAMEAGESDVAGYFKDNRLRPATAITGEELNNIWDGGFDGSFGGAERLFDDSYDRKFN